jgi:hypothetical protein
MMMTMTRMLSTLVGRNIDFPRLEGFPTTSQPVTLYRGGEKKEATISNGMDDDDVLM